MKERPSKARPVVASMIDVGLGACSVSLFVAGVTPSPYSMWAWCGALSGWIMVVVGMHLNVPKATP